MIHKTRPLILMIDDEADMRQTMRACLEPDYRVIEAGDGDVGIRKAFQTVPDLIISDIKMPKSDGFQVCQTLKEDERTSHIPIILLTAHSDRSIKISGLETGADVYLTKPFDIQELLVRVKNLIHLRRQLRETFRVGEVLKPGEIVVTSLDDQFLRKVKTIVDVHMGDEALSVEVLAGKVGMSRSQMHRKLISLTSLSPGDFIRYMRLHRAMELLKGRAATVSEVAFQVGFSSVTYFTRCFRKQFGFVPSDVNKRAKDPSYSLESCF